MLHELFIMSYKKIMKNGHEKQPLLQVIYLQVDSLINGHNSHDCVSIGRNEHVNFFYAGKSVVYN